MKMTIIQGNTLNALHSLPDESVDSVISSPPYYGLRSYKGSETIWGGHTECNHDWGNDIIKHIRGTTGGGNTGNNGKPDLSLKTFQQGSFCSKCHDWKGQLGLEPSYELYLDHIMQIMKELKRVLKKTGTLFWNVSDTYSGAGAGQKNTGKAVYGIEDFRQSPIKSNLPDKSLMLLPERFAIRMVDDGWILRNKLAWFKRNAMPSSVSDRFSNKWEYVFFFSKSQKYYFDLDSIRKPLAEASIK